MSTMILRIIFFLALSFIHVNCARTYQGYLLLSCVPKSDYQVDILKKLEWDYDLSFWKEPSRGNFPVDFIVASRNMGSVMQNAAKAGLNITVISDNIQSLINNETMLISRTGNPEVFDLSKYHTLQSIYQWLYHLETRYRGVVKVATIGTTKENRSILAVKIEFKDSVRSTVVIEGTTHAREWISTVFVNYMINELLHFKGSKNTWLSSIAEKYSWYFIPVVNPDGYVYTFTNNRLWRKNRNDPAVDLNRNFEPHFGDYDSPTNVDSEKYPGPEAFSENESKALKIFLEQQSNKLEFYFSMQSYGQKIIIPYSFAEAHFDNYYEAYTLAQKAVSALEKYEVLFNIGNSFETIGYKISGTSIDWVKYALRVPYVYAFELDTGSYGFLTPENRVSPICEQTAAAVSYILLNPSANFKKLDSIKESPLRASTAALLSNQFTLYFCLIIVIFCFQLKFYWK